MTTHTAGSARTSSHTSRTIRAMLAATAMFMGAGAFADDGQLLVTNSGSLTSMQLSTVTPVQNALPHVLHRGVNLDGSGRAGSAFGWSLNANSIGGGTVGGRTLNAVDLVTGSPSVSAIDLSLPAKQPWVVGRSFSSRQDDSGHHDSDGYQGRNWFQMSQPELVFEDEVADADDLIYLVYGADRYIEFRRVALTAGGYSTTEFRAVNGAAGVLSITRDSGSGPDLWTYHDQAGNTAVFFGFDDDASMGTPDADPCAGQLWQVSDPAGNIAYVGDSSTVATAISGGYDGSGQILYAYDSVDRRYTYTYSTIDSVSRLTQVKAETKTGGTWASPTGLSEVGKVAYGYYQTGDNTYGDNGCLKLVTVTTPLSDSGVSLEAKTYYRYWKGTFDDSTNPGHAYALQYIVEAEGYRRADWSDSTFDDDPQSMTETPLKPYASAAFEYEDRDSMNDLYGRVDKAWFNGECGCGGGSADGVHEFTYDTNTSGSWTSGYETAWRYRAVIERPDGTFLTQYFDELGQGLSNVITETVPGTGTPDTWVTEVVRDANGCVTEVHTPASISTYTHSTGSFGDVGTGLINLYERESSGDLTGFLRNRKWTEDNGSNVYFTRTDVAGVLPQDVGNATLNRPVMDESWDYFTAQTSESSPAAVDRRDYTYTVHQDGGMNDTVRIATVQFEQVQISAAQNGSGAQESTSSYYNEDGRLAFTKSPIGIIGYRAYNSNGRLSTSVADADTTETGTGEVFDGVTIPGGFSSWGTPEHMVSTFSYDEQGRSSGSVPSGFESSKVYHTELSDGRQVTIGIPRVVTALSTTYHGPASYTVTNLAGEAEFSGTIALSTTTTALTSWIDETKDDPIEALGVGTLSGVHVSVYDETGNQLDESRMYFELPGSPNYLPGTEGTHYDATFYGYDDLGRKWRMKDATGTISRTVFDDLGRGIESWTGTNDYSFSGGEASGPDDMVKVSATEYDSGADGGNSHVTESTLDPDGNWGTTSDQRVTEYLRDARGRTIVTINPQAPHSLVKYDEQGNVLAGASYTSSSGLDITDDPESLATNRVSLSATDYDAMGRAYESRVYQINQSTGAIEQASSNDKHLRTLTWYDPEGRVMKTEGQQTTKTRYDRIGRATHRFVLALDDDSQYGHASATTAIWDSGSNETSVANDKVATESQTVYELLTGNVLMSVTIERDYDDYGGGQSTGELDSNADGDRLIVTAADLSGRAQITAMWYDELGRLTDTVQLGTNGGSNYTRAIPSSAPPRSDTELVTTITYNTDGTRLEVQDPAGTKTRWAYDAAQRVILTISNYDNGTPSSATGDDDHIVRQEYTDGLQTKLWVDLDGDGTEDADDQVTLYIYGTTAGTPTQMKRTTGNLLRAVVYPDSTNTGTDSGDIDSDSSDVVSYAYNALGEQVYMKDQATTVIETDYDTAGRQLHRRATDTGSGIATDVLRITTAYTSRGQVDTVTQYNHATAGSGSVVDEVEFTYDEWGNVSTFDQDWNSAISGDSVDVDYTHAMARSQGSGVFLALRSTGMTLPDGTAVEYLYDSIGERHDDRLGRVSRVKVGATVVLRYEYSGVANLLGTELFEPDLLYTRYNTGGTVDRLDNFNRVTDDIWTRGIDTGAPAGYEYYRDFYDVDLSWSRSSNIDLVEDNVYPSWDVAYTNDGLERLTQAERGVWGGSSITTTVHDELWTLSQTGNWEQYQLDLDGNGVFTGTNELDDDQTFNVVNELTARDIDDDSTDDYTPVYDAAGNLTDDDKDYEFIYDAFGRLVEVQNQSQQTVAEYTYNGLGYRTGWHYDVDGDGTVEANASSTPDDPWFQFVYDARWRVTATYRASHHSSWTIDSDPKEQFVNHNAGLAGSGGSSYIDAVILRDRDANTAWESQADGTLEERTYYCQNWRADVVALMTDSGELIQQVRYDPYGVPFGIALADMEADGDIDNADYTKWYGYYTGGTHPYADWNWDGTVNSNDITAYLNDKNADSGLGRGDLSYAYSTAAGANRKGYAGYEIDPVLTGSEGWESVYHVRHRVYTSSEGRWTRRDPIGYMIKGQLYAYSTQLPILVRDPSGLFAIGGGGDGDWREEIDDCMAYSHAMFDRLLELEPGLWGPCTRQFLYDSAACCGDVAGDSSLGDAKSCVDNAYDKIFTCLNPPAPPAQTNPKKKKPAREEPDNILELPLPTNPDPSKDCFDYCQDLKGLGDNICNSPPWSMNPRANTACLQAVAVARDQCVICCEADADAGTINKCLTAMINDIDAALNPLTPLLGTNRLQQGDAGGGLLVQ